MSVKVKCPQCDKVLSAPDTARGKAIKCPECQTRIAVPAEDSGIKATGKKDKEKPKKPAKPADSEAALAAFDMRRAEDTEARICSKCGYDMKYQDEEDTECPKCGYDSEAGGMGAKARKKAMKGPDPADFYPGLFKQSWKFVGRNQMLAWRTVVYTLVCLLLSLVCAFLYLYIYLWPPRIFIGLVFAISFLVIPGWMWFLDTEVIKLTLERKDKFKKLNFDFFLASAMGGAFLFWCIAVALPVILIPAGLGYVLVNYAGMPQIVLPICAGLGVFPALWMLPVVMSHMSMPVQYKGWQIWKVVPMWAKNIKPLSVWLLLFIATNILNISGIAVIAAVYGQDIVNIVTDMEDNAELKRKKFTRIENPNAKRKADVKVAPQEKLGDPKKIDFFPLIVPIVILLVMTIPNGFTCMFNMRTNGQFTYYNKGSLELVDKLKEYKYVAKEKREDDEDAKPKTTSQQLVDAFAFVMIFDLLGAVGGMLYGTLTDAGVVTGVLLGVTLGHGLANFVIFIQSVALAFKESALWGLISLFGCYPIGFIVFVFQNFQERKNAFIRVVLVQSLLIVLMIVNSVMGVYALISGAKESAAPAVQQQMDPNQMMQNQPPGGQMPNQGSGPPAMPSTPATAPPP